MKTGIELIADERKRQVEVEGWSQEHDNQHDPMEFIRAPYIEKASDDVDVLATVDDNIVAVQYGNQIGLAFHPELTNDNRIHAKFLSLVK